MAKRNPNGAGSYYKLKSGSYCFSIMIGYRPDGSRNRISFYGRTKKEARAKYDAWQADQEAGINVMEKTEFGEFARFWYATHKRRITKTTAEGYRYALNKIIDCFGERQLRDIRAYDVE